jgi:Protein kinase domain
VSSDTTPKGFREGDLFAGKFRIERLLGQGGMGAVYLAMHEGLKKRLAIKVLLGEISGNAEAVARFMNEAQAAANIQNEHVARVDDVSKSEDGLPYMVMEYLEGQDLAQVLEVRTMLPQAEAVDYVLQALEAVHMAHEARIVHRDLKPSNLFLARRPDGSHIIKVLDFGISKMQSEQSGALTSTRSMLGSPLYMSPEQLRSSKSVDSRSDIWSIGVILYELLTGTLPYLADGLGELFAAILEQDAPKLRERNPNIDPGLEAVVMRCLAKKKEERWSSVAELAAGLAPYAPAGRAGTLAMRMTQGLIQGAPIVPMAAPSGPHATAALATGLIPALRAQAPSLAHQTGSASWATGSGARPELADIPKKPMGLIIGVAVVSLCIIGGGITALVSKKTATIETPAPVVTTAAVLAAPPPPPTLAVVEPPPKVEPALTASASVTAKVVTGGSRPIANGGVKAVTTVTAPPTVKTAATTAKPKPSAAALE